MVKEEAADFIGEGIAELITENPTEVVLDLVLGSIGEQLGVEGTGGFFAAALTHYAICQFAVLIGIATSPLKMDFSGITQAKILKKLEDLNKKVDKLISSPRVEALKHLKNGLLELQNKKINFLEARKRFEKVQDSATKALSREEDFNHMAVCTKYLLFAETMIHSFTEDYTEGGTNYGDCFLPIEKMTEDRKDRMATFLVSQVKELTSQMATKGKKKDDHRDKVDDILKMVYNIISVCKNLSNPNTLINNAITFGIDTDFVPFGEEDATVLQVGRDATDTEYLNPKEISDTDMKHMPAYTVYVWMKEEKKLCVRRALKDLDISTQYVHGSLVWVNLEETDGKLGCKYGAKKEGPFEMTIFPRNGYPKYIQRMDFLFKTAKAAKD